MSDWRCLITPSGSRSTTVHDFADAVSEALTRRFNRRLKAGFEVRVHSDDID